MRRPIQQALTQAPMALLDFPLLQGAWNLFGLMEIAEQEIAKQVEALRQKQREHRRYGHAPQYIDTLERAIQRVSKQAFQLLCPPEILRGKSPEVYRSHARELVWRVANERATTEATEAELLCAVLDMSLHAPLSQQYSALADQLFTRVMGSTLDDNSTPEPWTGATLEARVGLARSMVCRERVLRPLQ